jgi:hypothetical protein
MFGIRDPGSEIRDSGSGKNSSRIPDPWGKKAPDPGSRIRIRNTEHPNKKSYELDIQKCLTLHFL